jgi:transposase
MKTQLASDEFWARIEPLLPVVKRRRRHPGRKRIDDRACLEPIMYVLRTGCQWAMVPAETTGCSGKTRVAADGPVGGCRRLGGAA